MRRSAYHARFGVIGVHPDIARFVSAAEACVLNGPSGIYRRLCIVVYGSLDLFL